jgi:hypothetical protein
MNSLKALPMTEPHGKPSDTLEIRVVTSAEEIERFNRLCQEQHCLGAAHVVGDFLTSSGYPRRAMGGAAGLGLGPLQTQGLQGVDCLE